MTPLTQTDHSGSVYYQAAEMDIWRDSAIFYCDKMREPGGQAKFEIFPGVVVVDVSKIVDQQEVD